MFAQMAAIILRAIENDMYVQRLYRGMQKALSPLHLYINVGSQGEKPEWIHQRKNGQSRASLDTSHVPGPSGGQELHLLPPGEEQPSVSCDLEI